MVALAVSRVTDLAIAVIQPLAGPVAVLAALCLLLVLAMGPTVIELAVITRRHRADPGVRAEPYTTQLRSLGLTAWTVGSWAAWPPGRHAGRRLLDQLFPEVPAHVWLVASARDRTVLDRLRQRGFITPAGGGLLCVRPPAGTLTVPPADSRANTNYLRVPRGRTVTRRIRTLVQHRRKAGHQ